MQHQATRMFSVAPMIDWTDRHCRYFHRQLTDQAWLYTEMIVADAVLRGDREYLLGHSDKTGRVALQLGGNDPRKLAEAARIGEDFGYGEINLNVGCPSDRVQSGTFGACLMRAPDTVAECVAAMREAVDVEVTVKCRIGVDDQDPERALPDFVNRVAETGCRTFTIHARKAWLQGLSPKENRTIPPLDYELVKRLKAARPDLTIVLNGGITSIEQSLDHLGSFDGVMLGRAAYENPFLLARIDSEIYGQMAGAISRTKIAQAMIPYIDILVQSGGRAHQVTRHMIGLFHGQPGARAWRRHLTVEACKAGATGQVLADALKVMYRHHARELA